MFAHMWHIPLLQDKFKYLNTQCLNVRKILKFFGTKAEKGRKEGRKEEKKKERKKERKEKKKERKKER